MRLGFFGGSFDPPHRGHLAAACAARDHFGLETVLLAPTGRQPLKPEGPEAAFADRLRMTELLCAGERGLAASPIDAPAPDGAPNFTVDTLRRLRTGLPTAAKVYAIVGADAFLGLPQWRQATTLFDLAEWIVVSRPGFDDSQLQRMPLLDGRGERVHLLHGVNDPTSATDLRARLRAGLPCAEYLPAPVLRHIRDKGLYGSGSTAEEA